LSRLLTSYDPLSLFYIRTFRVWFCGYIFTYNYTKSLLYSTVLIILGLLFLGTCRTQPATNWFDESFATFLKSHERFARQHRSRPSITHRVTSANSRKDHQLSGIKNIILLHLYTKEKEIIVFSYFTFILILSLKESYLTIFSNSLIRVTRRVEKATYLHKT